MLGTRPGFDRIESPWTVWSCKAAVYFHFHRVFPQDAPSVSAGGLSMSMRLSSVARHIGVALLWMLAGIGLPGIGFPGAARAQLNGGGEPAVALGAGRGVQGTVTAVAADHLTMKTERGELYQVALSPNTRVLKNRESIKLTEVHPGDGIGAIGELDAPNKTIHALYLMVVDAEQIRKAREALGKTWITGTVTAVDETRITVRRPDQVSQVISVDEGTSFRRGGRSMQMAMGREWRTDARRDASTRPRRISRTRARASRCWTSK